MFIEVMTVVFKSALVIEIYMKIRIKRALLDPNYLMMRGKGTERKETKMRLNMHKRYKIRLIRII